MAGPRKGGSRTAGSPTAGSPTAGSLNGGSPNAGSRTGEAGQSALARYRVLRARRRRRAVVGVALLTGVFFAAVVGNGSSYGPHPGGVPLALLVLAGAGTLALGRALSGPGARDIDRWRRGAAGERRTAELLDGLSSRRWAVWHDLPVPGSRANIDHVVVGRTGVWVVDTKSTRAEVTVGWRSVHLGERRLDTGPVRWEAEVLEEQLRARSDGRRLEGRAARVRPVVCVHGQEGAWVPALGRRGVRSGGGVRVVAAVELTDRVQRGRRRLSRWQIAAACEAVDSLAGGERIR
jgi:hypothetical protein